MLEIAGEVNAVQLKIFSWCEGPPMGDSSYVRVQLNEKKVKIKKIQIWRRKHLDYKLTGLFFTQDVLH